MTTPATKQGGRRRPAKRLAFTYLAAVLFAAACSPAVPEAPTPAPKATAVVVPTALPKAPAVPTPTRVATPTALPRPMSTPVAAPQPRAQVAFTWTRERHEHDEDVVMQRIRDGIEGVMAVGATSTGVSIDYDPQQVTPEQIRERLVSLGYQPGP